ncbi:hypothetical protein GEV33_014101 [Tenebrio molitor]|uniref:Uncharacterized protein n=1 Tax=Tenebrio molitor TaxID=7067 RepID=A0A8J6LDA4_TENMO|nr:hypothetical protein GEV33_014101 [Tenebrio molitor]
MRVAVRVSSSTNGRQNMVMSMELADPKGPSCNLFDQLFAKYTTDNIDSRIHQNRVKLSPIIFVNAKIDVSAQLDASLVLIIPDKLIRISMSPRWDVSLETVEESSLKSRSEPTEISSIRRRGVKCQSFADGGFRMSGGRWQDQRRESSPTPVLCSLKLGTLVTADRTIPKVNLLLQLTRTGDICDDTHSDPTSESSMANKTRTKLCALKITYHYDKFSEIYTKFVPNQIPRIPILTI